MGRHTKQLLQNLADDIHSVGEALADLRLRLWELEHPKDGNARKPEAAPIYTPVEVLKCHLRALKSGEIFEQSWSEEHDDVGSKTCGLTDEFRVAIVAHDAVEVPDDARS